MARLRSGQEVSRARRYETMDVSTLNTAWARTEAEGLSFSTAPVQKQGRPRLPSLNTDYSQALSAQTWSTGS